MMKIFSNTISKASSYQFVWQVAVILQSSPELLEHLFEGMKTRVWFELI